MAESTEVIARGVLIHAGNLLICRGGQGHLFLPGGHVEFNESAPKALEREMMEELGWSMQAGEFIGVSEASFAQKRKGGIGDKWHHEINLVFLMRPADPSFDPAQATSQELDLEFAWVPLKGLAERRGNERILPDGIEHLIARAERINAGQPPDAGSGFSSSMGA